MTRKPWDQWLRAVVYSAAILLFFIGEAGNVSALRSIVSVLSVAAVILSLFRCSKLARTLSLFFLLSGSWMLYQGGAPPAHYLYAYGNMLHLLGLFAIIPLLSVPIRLGGYGKSIEQLLQQKVRTVPQLYRTISGFSFFLSSFINLATLPMMYYTVKDSVERLPLRFRKRFITSGIVHGYALPILWSPVAPIVGVVFDLTGAHWVQMFPFLFTFSLIALWLDWCIARMTKKRFTGLSISLPSENRHLKRELTATIQTETIGDLETLRRSRRNLIQLGSIIAAFIVLIVILEHFSPLGMVLITALLTLPFSAAWSSLLGLGEAYWNEFRRHVEESLPGMAEQFAIFLSAGFFVKALQWSGFHHEVNTAVLQVHHWIGAPLFLALLPLIPLGLAFMGMHPVVAIALLAESLDPNRLGISVHELTLALLGGAVTTFIMGPFNATLGIMSSIISENPLRIAAWSWPFTAGLIAMVILSLFLIP